MISRRNGRYGNTVDAVGMLVCDLAGTLTEVGTYLVGM